MPLPPWIIQELEEERARREEEERVRSSRIELPQLNELNERSSNERERASERSVGGVAVLDISPRDANVIDI